MVDVAMKHMASNFAELGKFEGVDFRICQKNMHFLLSSMNVVYVLTTLIHDNGDDGTVKQLRKRSKWDNDDYVCRGLILKGMSDPLFDIYQIVESRKELCDSLEAKYMVEDASSKKFLVRNFTNYKMTDSRPVMKQYNELLEILGRFTQHKMYMDEAIQVFCIIDELPPSWKDFKHTLKNKKEELTMVELGSHLRIKEFLKVQDNDKPKGNNAAGPLLGHVHFKRMQDMSKDGLILAFDMDTEKCNTCMLTKITKKPFQNVKCKTKVLELIHSDLCDPHATPSLGNKKYFVTFIDDASRVSNKRNMITPYELWSKKKPNLNYLRVWGYRAVVRLPDPKMKTLGERGIEDIGGLVVYEKVTEEKEAINDEMDSIMGNNTWVLADLPLGIDYFHTYAPVACIRTIRLLIVMASIHNLVIHQMDIKTAFLNGDLDEEVYMNQPQGFIMPGNKTQEFRELCIKNKVNFVGLQETKMESIDLLSVRSCWGIKLMIVVVYAPQVASEK
nr:zinc finger, CCHC-type [Tanacetum cinerariifolium]